MINKVADFPERINIEPTNRCNMQCKLCPHPRMQRSKGFMDLDLLYRIVSECARHGTAVWLQYMGEPLMHPRIIEMISVAKNAGIQKLGLSTNAFFLDEELGRKILESGLDRLECSVDALDEKGFLESRGSPDFKKVIRNIQRFLLLKREKGTSKPVTSIQYMECLVSPEHRFTEIRNLWEDLLDVNDFIMSIRDYSFAGSVRSATQPQHRFSCRWIFRSSVILWDGTVVLCGSDFDGRAAMGNVNHQSIEEIWKGAGFEAVRELHRKRDWKDHPLCRGCDDWKLSDGSGYVNLFKGVPG